jgi:alkylhydroperoxidase/carboxymuconolactone decarboxylase family protein YurZ
MPWFCHLEASPIQKELRYDQSVQYPSKIAFHLHSDEVLKGVIGGNYNSAKVLNVIKMMAGTEDMFEAATGFIEAMFQAKGVDPRIREMIMLRVGKVLNSPYEWQANAILARNAGLSEEEIESAASDGPVANVDPRFVLVCKATDELSTRATLFRIFAKALSCSDLLLSGWPQSKKKVPARLYPA